MMSLYYTLRNVSVVYSHKIKLLSSLATNVLKAV